MQWNNAIQKAVIEEWTEGVQEAKGPRAKQILRRRLAKKYDVGINVVQGIIGLGATQGLNRIGGGEMQDGRRWEPINYHELVGDLRERVRAVERKLDYFLDGVARVLEDGETMANHIRHLREMSRWVKGRKAIDLENLPRLK